MGNLPGTKQRGCFKEIVHDLSQNIEQINELQDEIKLKMFVIFSKDMVVFHLYHLVTHQCMTIIYIGNEN